MASELTFIECDNCRAKPGTPILCTGCLHNRESLIAAARERDKLRSEPREYRNAIGNPQRNYIQECNDGLAAKDRLIETLRAERDAALKRVAELEGKS